MLAILVASGLTAAPAAAAEKAAVFEFEFINGGMGLGVPTEQESERLRMVGERLRKHLEQADHFDVIDIGPVAEMATASNLQSCGNCADRFAREVGADYAITGTVQKGLRTHPQHQRLCPGRGDVQASRRRKRRPAWKYR
jgi:hypothetical protein